MKNKLKKIFAKLNPDSLAPSSVQRDAIRRRKLFLRHVGLVTVGALHNYDHFLLPVVEPATGWQQRGQGDDMRGRSDVAAIR